MLFCKVINQDRSARHREQEIRQIDLPRRRCIVLALNQVLSDSQLSALYRSAHCYVSPMRGRRFRHDRAGGNGLRTAL